MVNVYLKAFSFVLRSGTLIGSSFSDNCLTIEIAGTIYILVVISKISEGIGGKLVISFASSICNLCQCFSNVPESSFEMGVISI